MTCCGLIIERADREPIPVPLTGVSVQARIIDLVAEVTIQQRYVNKENQPIEAVYLFPLDEGAGICKFTAEVDGRVIEGVVKETKEAQEDYDEAIQSGHSAFLVEEKLPDVFKAKVGNLAAGSGAKISLTYVTELKVEGKEIRFYLPTTIAPRYVPSSDKSSAAADLASVQYTEQSNYQVEFNASVRMASAIKEIRCPTHKIAVDLDAATPLNGTFRLDNVVTSMDRDLVFYIQVAEPNQPRLIHEKSPTGTTAMMLSLVPTFKLADQKTELIFLVDRSGSMGGVGIGQAKQALKLFLHSLPLDCYVNIAGFGFTYEELFPESRKYDEVILNTAKAYAEKIDANLGGTEILQPLEIIFKKPPIDGYLRQVFVLTDGEVSNANEVLSLVRRHNGQARVFALGLGSSASHHLVEGMARAGNGTALFASLEERLEKKVMQQLQDALQPSLTDIKVKWEGHDETEQSHAVASRPVQTEKTLMGYGKPLEADPATTVCVETPEKKFRQAPCNSMIPAVFDGRHLIVYALLAEDAQLPKWAEVVAVSPDGPLTLKINVTASNLEQGQIIHSLAARKLIQILQDREGNNEDTNTKKEIVQLGCRYGLASKYTSYVAVDPKVQKELKESWMMMKSRDVPLHMAHGWGGGFRLVAQGGCAPVAMACSSAPPMMRSAMAHSLNSQPPMMKRSMARRASPSQAAIQCDSIVGKQMPQSFDMQGDAFDSVSFGMPRGAANFAASIENHPEEIVPEGNTNDDKLIKLVSSQNFDGSFKLEKTFASLLDTTVEDIKQAGLEHSYSEQVWATAVALAYLSIALIDLQDTWMLVAKKAESWLRSSLQPTGDDVTCTKAAQDFVKSKLNL
ncbi:von Willebrand factor A domain-containing protein 5A-like [Daphnia carinata]|uniref:von Willebrand factor A domain-containing protein 5A-like n=1 Tax=Daphnia carinata TaxID=120202 RepID=UPI00257AF2EF|nr:von Willebrand factor A domain-containing protein 5A-like [Daphnia carinata]